MAAVAQGGIEDEHGRRRRLTILAVCCASLLIVGLDVTIVNVALPSIAREFKGSISGLQWVVDAYTLVLASLLLLSGSTADRFGRRRTFITGLAIFSAGSLLCSVAGSLGMLIAFRMMQAVGGSMLNPVAMSIITNTFTDPRERAQAVGVWGAVVGVSIALGPVLGGLLVTSSGWRSVFWINVPVGLAAIALTLRFVPESRAPRARRFDAVGQLLVIVLLAGVTFAIIEAPSRGIGSPEILLAVGLAIAALIGLVTYEPRREEPLIDVRFLHSIPFASATATAVAAFAAFGGFLFANTLYLQGVRGLSPLHAGLATLPLAVATMVLAPISGRIVGRRGARLPLIGAGIAITAACIALTGIDAKTPLIEVLIPYTVFGIGFGLVNAPITNTAVSGMPRAQAGVAAGIASTSRQVGATLGVAIVGALVAGAVNHGAPTYSGTGASIVWIALAVCGALVLVLGIYGTSSRARASAERTAIELNPEGLEAAQVMR
jgi:EmrB/QacA subfamily drug resistance transporter